MYVYKQVGLRLLLHLQESINFSIIYYKKHHVNIRTYNWQVLYSLKKDSGDRTTTYYKPYQYPYHLSLNT